MHVFLHELGHHHDLMMTRSRRKTARGERYAEKYALWHSKDLWLAAVLRGVRPAVTRLEAA